MKQSRIKFIKRAHESACSEWKTEIEKEFPKLFSKSKLEVWKWYKVINSGKQINSNVRENDLIFIELNNKKLIEARLDELNTNLLAYKNHIFGYKICGEKFLFGDDVEITGLVLATDKEVEQALIEEAKKRGFKKGDVINRNFNEFNQNTDSIKVQSNKYYLEPNMAFLQLGGNEIFAHGKWAEIIKTISKEDAEKELGKIIIG